MSLGFSAYVWNQPKPHDRRHGPQFPSFIAPGAVRLVDGDVLIRLSPSDSDTCLVHSSILKKSKWFEAGLNDRWSPNIKHTVKLASGEEVRVWKYGLVVHDKGDACTLERDTAPSQYCLLPVEHESWKSPEMGFHPCAPGMEFHLSEYSTGLEKRSDTSSATDVFKTWLHLFAARDHRILFRLLYGLPVEFKPSNSHGRIKPDHIVKSLANVVTYAEFYGLLEYVAARVIETLGKVPNIWTDVAKEPIFHLGLAVKLRWSILYDDALRHVVGGCHDLRWDSRLFDLVNKDMFRLRVYELRESLTERTNALRIRLQNLALSTKPEAPNDRHGRHKTTKALPATFLGDQTHRSTTDGHRFLARSLYGEWLTAELSGPDGDRDGWYSRCTVSEQKMQRSLRKVCNLILTYAKREDPSCLLGHEAAARLTSTFQLGRYDSDVAVTKTLQDELKKILNKAAEVINQFFWDNERHEARYGRIDHFTNLDLNPEDRPWPEAAVYEPFKPDVEVEKASSDWIRAVFDGVGLHHMDAVDVWYSSAIW